MRAAVRNLESLALGRNAITDGDADALSERIVRKDLYDLMGAIFRENEPMKARRMYIDTDETPDYKMLWIDENMPFEFKDKGDLIRGYDRLARADVFMGRVHRRQYYRFWAYAGDLMSAGVNMSRRTDKRSHERFRFPMYMMKMSRSKSIRALKASVCLKLAELLHTSTNRISNDVLPPLKAMLRNDHELARSVVISAGLEAEEIAFLLDAKVDSKTVRDIMAPEAKAGAPQAAPKDAVIAAKEAPSADVEKKEQPRSQKSLFQF
jgi:replication factor C large subunit